MDMHAILSPLLRDLVQLEAPGASSLLPQKLQRSLSNIAQVPSYGPVPDTLVFLTFKHRSVVNVALKFDWKKKTTFRVHQSDASGEDRARPITGELLKWPEIDREWKLKR